MAFVFNSTTTAALIVILLLTSSTIATCFILYHPPTKSCVQAYLSRCFPYRTKGGKNNNVKNTDEQNEDENLLFHETDIENSGQKNCDLSSTLSAKEEQIELEQFIVVTKKALDTLGENNTYIVLTNGGQEKKKPGLSNDLRRLLLSESSDMENRKHLNGLYSLEEGRINGGKETLPENCIVNDYYGSTNDVASEKDIDSDYLSANSYISKRRKRTSTLQNKNNNDEDEELIFSGLPKLPFYREVAIRLFLLTKHHHYQQRQRQRHSRWWRWKPWRRKNNQHVVPNQHSYLIDASILGMTEFKPPTLPPIPTQTPSVQELMSWLDNAGDDGILHLLGMRRTVGTPTDTYLLPPDWTELLRAANRPHKKPKTSSSGKPHKMLTVAARARTKHAHRGSKDLYFGTISGSAESQNVVTQEVLLDMLHDAVWINIHVFSGQVHPVLEIRVEEGYGARWTIMANEMEKGEDSDDKGEEKVIFRGFLEPQMEDGHEKKWRH